MSHPLVDQLRFARSEFARGLTDITPAEAERRFGSMNCISWIVGHLAWQEQRYWLFRAQGKVLIPELNTLVGYGRPACTPPVEEMWAYWREITQAADPWLDELDPEKIKVSLGGTNSSIGTFLQRVIYHYWYHLGEGMAIRQMLGHTNLPEYVGDIDSQAPYRPESGETGRPPIRKEDFLRQVQEAYAQWDALIASLEDEHWLRHGDSSPWTLKDIVAHLVWHEKEMLGLLRTRTFAGSDWWNLPLDERNLMIYEANQERPLSEVRSEAQETRNALMPLIEALTDEDLNDPGHFAGMPSEWRPGEILADNTFLHYLDHYADLKNRIKETTG